MPAYFNNTVYFGAIGDTSRRWRSANARLSATPASQTPTTFGYARRHAERLGERHARTASCGRPENGMIAVLHAYDATNLANELYNSNQAGSRDQFGQGNKFITPMIANGKVYVGTSGRRGGVRAAEIACAPHATSTTILPRAVPLVMAS